MDKALCERLVSPDTPLLQRAIDLFEFQIGLVRRQKAKRRARIYAAMKLAEYYEKAEGFKPATLVDAVPKSKEYRYVFAEVMAGGWFEIRKLPSDKAFDKAVQKRLKEAAYAANVIDFLYRYDPKKYRRKLSDSIAKFVVAKASSYATSPGKTTAKELWGKYRASSIFLYLLLIQKFELQPPRIGTKNFAKKLLASADDVKSVREFFFAYNAIAKDLNAKGQRFPLLKLLVTEFDSPHIPIDGFAKDIEEKIGSYVSNIDWSDKERPRSLLRRPRSN